MTIYKYIPILANREKYFKTEKAAIEYAKKDMIACYKKGNIDIVFDRVKKIISPATSEPAIYIYFNRVDTNQPYICAYIILYEIEEEIDWKEVYNIIKTFINKSASNHKITDLNKYYSSTDKLFIPGYEAMNWRQQVFASMALHAQNAQRISNVIQFINNYSKIKSIFLNFDCDAIIKTYGDPSDRNPLNCKNKGKHYYRNENALISQLSNNLSINEHSSMLKGYIRSILSTAYFLSSFKGKNKNDFCQYLLSKGADVDIVSFLSNNFERYGTTLPYDLLKEIDSRVFDFVKPDVHIKEFNRALGFINEDPAANVNYFKEAVKNINKNLPKNEQLSNYKLDRIIWLICTQKFFLDNNKPRAARKTKEEFLKAISECA